MTTVFEHLLPHHLVCLGLFRLRLRWLLGLDKVSLTGGFPAGDWLFAACESDG